MKGRKMLLSAACGVLIAGGIITWLMSGKVTTLELGNGVTVQANTNMKNTKISRDKDGVKLWEFDVEEIERDTKHNKAILKGIKGKVFRSDGSYIDVTATNGEATLNKKDNNFMVEGNVQGRASTGARIFADKFTYVEKTKIIQALGHVRAKKDDYTIYGDKAETTVALDKFKVIGHAKLEKGGTWDDK